MVKISHETPLCLLEYSREFNNYDYALPHLFDSEPGYLEYFRKSKKMGRYIIMDNSLHELGHAYDTDRLLYWINEFEPDEFIVPDVWQDRDKSVVNARQWAPVVLPENTTKVAVVQAQTIHEAATCYQTYKDLGYKKIAFSYGASYYNDVVPHPNKDLGKALGRISVISILHKIGVIEDNDRVHLLGCSVPQEFGWYQGFKFIESIDTSNPIMAALEGIRYTEFGLTQKPKANINDCLYMFEDQIDFDILDHNLIMFATINNL